MSVLRLAHAARVAAAREDGVGLIELVVASSVLAVGLLGLLATMATSLKYVGVAQQRQSATQIGQTRIEEIRKLDYAAVALTTGLVHSTSTPDASLSADGQYLDVTGGTSCVSAPTTSCEPVYVSASGLVEHVQTRVMGPTDVTVYTYVTWVDDTEIAGTTDYKRVTVVAEWARSQLASATNSVRLQTFVARSAISASSTPTPTPASSPSPTPSASPTPTATPSPAAAACTGDTTAPVGTMSILTNSGSGYVNSSQITVQLSATDDCTPLTGQVSNNGSSWGPSMSLTSATASQTSWVIPTTDGVKAVYARFVDGNGYTSDPVLAQVTLDTSAPDAPGDFTATACTISGADRTVAFRWTSVLDASLRGYRLYRSDLASPIDIGLVVAGTDVSSKSKDVTYDVRAYDAAGNESPASTTVTYAKNAC